MYCILKKIDFLHIEMSEREKPTNSNWLTPDENERLYKQWQSTLRVYRIKDGDEHGFLKEAQKENGFAISKMSKALSEGIEFDWSSCEVYIDCTTLACRAENACCDSDNCCGNGFKVRLKPVESEDKLYTKQDLIEAHYIGASFGYGKKAVTVQERLDDFELWYNNKLKRK